MNLLIREKKNLIFKLEYNTCLSAPIKRLGIFCSLLDKIEFRLFQS